MQAVSKRLTNYEATKLISQLYKTGDDQKKIIQQAFEIYHQINGKKDDKTINKMLKIYNLSPVSSGFFLRILKDFSWGLALYFKEYFV